VLAAHLPADGQAEPYGATTEQIWALYDAVPDHLRVAVLLGALAGLRVGEAAALRVADVDFIRGIVHPVQQFGGKPLKTEGSDQPVPIPRELTLLLAASVQTYGTEWMVTNGWAGRAAGWSSCGPSQRPAARSRGCLRDSAITTCATTWRRY